jgi:hypothetical protein
MRLSIARILLLCRVSILTTVTILSACSIPQKMNDTQLQSRGIRVGTQYWLATSLLSQDGYNCSVSGTKRERFDCTKNTGFFPTCILRIEFNVDDENKISEIGVREPACLGIP